VKKGRTHTGISETSAPVGGSSCRSQWTPNRGTIGKNVLKKATGRSGDAQRERLQERVYGSFYSRRHGGGLLRLGDEKVYSRQRQRIGGIRGEHNVRPGNRNEIKKEGSSTNEIHGMGEGVVDL